MRTALVALALLSACTCARDPLVGSAGSLRASPATVEFADTWLEATSHRALTLQNLGRTELPVALATSAPFGSPAEVVVAAGATVEVELSFSPTTLLRSGGTLTATSAGELVTVDLSGWGVERPRCEATECRDARLDEATMSCIQTAKADGTVCSAPCVESGVCVAGACSGAPKRCDDSDPCTTDACDELTGCVVTPAGCQPPSPCLVGYCVPDAGCVAEPVTDGTSCGEADCVTAQVCIAGQCVARPVPEGTECAPPTLCQERGRCVAQRCVHADA